MKKLFLLTISTLLAFSSFGQTPGMEKFKVYAGDVAYSIYNMSSSGSARAGFLAVNDTTDTLYVYVGAAEAWIISNNKINMQDKFYVESGTGNINFDDGISNSPFTYWIDADDNTFSIQKLDAGNTQFVSNEGDFIFNPAGNNIMPGSDDVDILGQADTRWANAFLTMLHLGDSTTGDVDAIIYFADDGDITVEYIRWDDGNDRFEMSDDLYTAGTFLSGDITIEDATPALNFKDTDPLDGDINAYILVDASDTASGSEDIDFSIYQQVNGSILRTLFSDADAGIWLYPQGSSTDFWAITATEARLSMATPSIDFYDSDGAVGDINASLDVDLTNTGDGTEDADVTISGQVTGALTAFLVFDADATLELISTTDIVLDPTGNNVLPGSDNADALGVSGTAWADVFIGNGGIIDFNAGDATITHSADLITISNAYTRVDRLEIDGANDWIDVATDIVINAAADIQLDPAGNNVIAGSDNADDLGRADLRWRDGFYKQLSIGDSTTGDVDGLIYFADDADVQAESFGWDDGDNRFEVTGDFYASGTIISAGDVTISDATPALIYKDTDGAVADDNATISVNLTDVGDGTEDADVTFMQQVNGTPTNWLVADADGVVTIGTAAQNTTIAGDLGISPAAGVINGSGATSLTISTSSAGADIILDAADAASGIGQQYVSITGTIPAHGSGTPVDVFLDISPTIGNPTVGSTISLIDITFTTPNYTTNAVVNKVRGLYIQPITGTPDDGTQTVTGITIEPTIGNATTGNHEFIAIDIAGWTGDAQVSSYALRIGELTATAATENAIEIGANWDLGINDASGITSSGQIQAEHLVSTDDADINNNLTVGDIIIDEAAGVLSFTSGTSATISTSTTDVELTLDVAGSGGTAFVEIIDDNNAGFLSVGRTTATEGSRLSITDGGGDNKAGELVLYEDDGNGSYLWYNTASVLRTANTAPADDDADGYAIIDATNGTIGASGQQGTFDDVTLADDLLLANGSVIGITGNEVITFDAAGTITISGAEAHFANNAAAATFGAVGTDADVVLAFDAVTNQGSITYMEDEDRFDFDNNVDVIGNLTANTFTSDGIIASLGAVTFDNNAGNTTAIMTLENTAGDFQVFRTDATPESVVTGSIGDLAVDGTNGKIYIKNSGSATNTGWIELSSSSINLAEMKIHDNSTALTIDSQDKEHAVRLFSAGDLNSWTFDAGSTGAIANTASGAGGVLRITDVAHGLVTGDFVTITGLTTASQNDVTIITKIDDDNFDCEDITFSSGSETGTWNQGGNLIAGTGALGIYQVSFFTSATATSATHTFEWHIYIGTTRQDDMGIRRKFSSTDLGTVSGSAFITVADGDVLWLSVQNIGASGNLTHVHANINLHRL